MAPDVPRPRRPLPPHAGRRARCGGAGGRGLNGVSSRSHDCHSGAQPKAANPEPMNTGFWNMGSGLSAVPSPGMTVIERALQQRVCVMKAFVTGGSGLVGSTVIDMLLARGDAVVAIDNFATGRRDNLVAHPRLRLVEDSIAEAAIVDELVGGFRPDVVVHTAASYKDPDDWHGDALTNCVGSANIARACRTYNIPRLIYFQ